MKKKLKKQLPPHVHCNIIYNCQEGEATQMSINGRVDKENGVSTRKGMLLSLKKEENPVTCYSMDKR